MTYCYWNGEEAFSVIQKTVIYHLGGAVHRIHAAVDDGGLRDRNGALLRPKGRDRSSHLYKRREHTLLIRLGMRDLKAGSLRQSAPRQSSEKGDARTGKMNWIYDCLQSRCDTKLAYDKSCISTFLMHDTRSLQCYRLILYTRTVAETASTQTPNMLSVRCIQFLRHVFAAKPSNN